MRLVFDKMTSFSLIQLKNETNLAFIYRVYGWATEWCPLATEETIPKEGPVRNVWESYMSIRALSDADLSDEVYDAEDDDTCKSHEIEGVYARTRLALLHAEEERRKTSS